MISAIYQSIEQTLNNSKPGKITNIKIKFIEILSFLYSDKKRNEK